MEKEYSPEELAYLSSMGQQQTFDSDFAMWRLDINEIIGALEHDLRGEYWDNNKKMWLMRGDKLLNDNGIKTILSLVSTAVNKVTFLSNIDDDDIRKIMLEFNLALIELLFFKWKDFHVQKEHLNLIVTKIIRFIYLALKRAEGGGERESLTHSTRDIRMHTDAEKKSGLRIPLPFGKKGE